MAKKKKTVKKRKRREISLYPFALVMMMLLMTPLVSAQSLFDAGTGASFAGFGILVFILLFVADQLRRVVVKEEK